MNPSGEAGTLERNERFRAVASMSGAVSTAQRRADPMRRFIPTPYSAFLPVMGRTVRLETNSPKILKHVVDLFARYPGALDEDSAFLWRIVVESDTEGRGPWPRRHAFSDRGLRFLEFGQRNFLAVDLEAREGIGFLSQGLAEDELGFTSPYLDNLFCLTVNSLGLVPIWANCVAQEERGVLLFGDPNSGKTSAGYFAEKLGLNFYADEGVFIELDADVLNSWGGFWPATFRPQSLQFFPELKECTRPCLHQHFTVHHRTTRPSHSSCVLPVKPVCCLFLEREASAVPSFSRMAQGDSVRRLGESVLFKDDDRFLLQTTSVVNALGALPAYVLHYGCDPAVAAKVARDLLAVRDFNAYAGVLEPAIRGNRPGVVRRRI